MATALSFRTSRGVRIFPLFHALATVPCRP